MALEDFKIAITDALCKSGKPGLTRKRGTPNADLEDAYKKQEAWAYCRNFANGVSKGQTRPFRRMERKIQISLKMSRMQIAHIYCTKFK